MEAAITCLHIQNKAAITCLHYIFIILTILLDITDKTQCQERKEKTSRTSVEPSNWCRNLSKSHGKCFMILHIFNQLLTIILPIYRHLNTS